MPQKAKKEGEDGENGVVHVKVVEVCRESGKSFIEGGREGEGN